MSKRLWLPAILISLTLTTGPATAQQPPLTQAQAQSMLGSPGGFEQFAWSLFVQAARPAGSLLMFETWAEQCQLNPLLLGCPPATTAAAERRLGHTSGLLLANRRKAGNAPVVEITPAGLVCSNPMFRGSLDGYPAPSNVAPNATFCEQVFVNASEQSFVMQNGLTTLSGQQAYGAKNGNAVTFPWDAIEIKADWVPSTSYTGTTFSCPDPNLYTQMYNGVCYALVGLHISSKVVPDWVWATFEPASAITNPNRCDPNLYSTCFDPWGTTSSVPYGKGQTVPQSPQLQALMAASGLNPVFKNYYLTGAQWQFVDGNNNNKPIPLGNSFVEFNAQVPPGQASCITCHKYAYFDGKKPPPNAPEDNFGSAPQNTNWPNIGYACNTGQSGNCTPVVPNSTSQDFSWMLGLMPY